ncbi:MAG: glycosyltransferase family 2 protein, partial [Candidatus Dormibacteraceae bacterium]
MIIPTYNGAALTASCLDALLADPPAACDASIVVVDDGSPEDPRAALAGYANRIELVVQGANTGFAGACNAGARAAGECDYLAFLNNDTIPAPGWLDALVAEAESDDELAAVGAKLLYPNGQIQHAGITIHQNGLPHHLYAGFPGDHPAVNRPRDVVAVTAACMLVRHSDFHALDGFDPGFHNAYEDVDLCLRIRELGRRVRYCPGSVVVHLESVTRFPTGIAAGTEASERLYAQRWLDRVVPDDVQHYVQDGLLKVAWGPHCPLIVSVAPELGVIRRDGEELDGLERLLAARSDQVLELLSAETRRLLRDRAAPRPALAPSRRSEPTPLLPGREHRLGDGHRLISIVMPVKNGAPHLPQMLEAVLGQSISARLEIVAIDSGSSDGTLDVLERFGARVLAIEPSAFDHGLTRNLLAEHARGDVLVFLTQRACPADETWLAPLVAGLDGDPRVVGVCSRLIPRADADALTRRDVERDLSGLCVRQHRQIDDWSEYERMGPEEARRFLNFHTVSAAIRADALRRTPFRSVATLGEDLLWAREVVESGWAIVHEPASRAYHSHAYTLDALFGRNVDDGVANRDIVGRSMAREEIAARVRTNVHDDWAYLRDELGLDGAELAHWQVEAVLRRVAQAAGQWVWTNHETLPAGTAAC